jgi:tetratricopeptide (TPR) repeat protein
MAQLNATGTMQGEIAVQCGAIPNEIANNNEIVLQARIAWLATLTPAPDCLPAYVPSATALYDRNHPTATVTPTLLPTTEATAQVVVPAETTIEPDASGAYDLAGLLAEAQAQIAAADWANAIETLDVIIRIDPEFERDRVRTLMSQALNAYANFLYNSGAYAEAILVTNRAEQFGPLADGLAYEREAAQLYLNATRSVGLTYDEVIRRLRLVYDLGQGRYYAEVTQLLYEQHMAYGDALVAQGNACFAATQYGFALNYANTAAAASKRDSANFTCQNVPPTTDPSILPTTAGGGAPLEGGTPIAPVGSRDG